MFPLYHQAMLQFSLFPLISSQEVLLCIDHSTFKTLRALTAYFKFFDLKLYDTMVSVFAFAFQEDSCVESLGSQGSDTEVGDL